jgi:arylsulfatase A-like enzyme
LKKNGAYMANIGKLYHHTSTAEQQLAAFDRLELCDLPTDYRGISKGFELPPCPGRRFQYSSDPVLEHELIKRAAKSRELRKLYPPGHPDWWVKVQHDFQQLYAELVGDCGTPDECTHDGRVAACAQQMLREFAGSGKQFFLSVGFARPHTPLLAPKKYVDMYDPAEAPLPQAKPENDCNIPGCAKRYGNEPDIFNGAFADEFPQLRESDQRSREAIAAYYACASFIDAQVGRLLDTLDETGLAEDTVVVYFGDHGFHLGEHGMWSKYTMFEQVTRVPLIIYVPGARGNGQVCEEIVELVDFLPTFCELWQIERPDNFEGTSFLPLLEEPQRPWKKAAFITSSLYSMNARTVRTKRYRYTKWVGSKGRATELYDLQEDPWEQNNLAADAVYADPLEQMQDLLKGGWRGVLPDT